jgi:phosphoribulokinase
MAKVDGEGRSFTEYENEVYLIRKAALEAMQGDTMFKQYSNTNFNLIPLIEGKSKKVFVLTGPKKTGVVIFGNDYVLEFNKNNKLKSRKKLHKNIIAMDYAKQEGTITMHTHLPETGDLITSTDICTLMLYEKFAKWKQHYVVGDETVNLWDCESNTLIVLPKKVFLKIGDEKE